MMARKIYIVSHREPSGVTWLVNCLLELGIKTYRGNDPTWMWKQRGDAFYLNPAENLLKKWMPILSTQEKFVFKHDIEIQWMHEWPNESFKDNQVIYFIRDPRDSIFSRYKRERLNISYEEFVFSPDSYSLLDRIDTWKMFNESWLNFTQFDFFRFEDYKKDAETLLSNILNYIDVTCEKDEITKAISNSTAAKAREAEQIYLGENKDDKELINRGGKIGSWKDLNESDLYVAKTIESECSSQLKFFGYDESNPDSEPRNKEEINNNNFINYHFYENLSLLPRDKLVPFLNSSKTPISSYNFDQYLQSGIKPAEIKILRLTLENYLSGIHDYYNEKFSTIPHNQIGDHYIREIIRLRCALLFESKNDNTYYDYILLKELTKKVFRLFGKLSPRIILQDIASKLRR